MAPPAAPTPLLFEKLLLLLRIERGLLEAEEPDWERLTVNLARIEKLIKPALPGGQFIKAETGRTVPSLLRLLDEAVALRHENMEILRAKACRLGRRLSTFRQEKDALRTYADFL